MWFKSPVLPSWWVWSVQGLYWEAEEQQHHLERVLCVCVCVEKQPPPSMSVGLPEPPWCGWN